MTSETTAHREELLRDSAWLRRLSHNLTHDGDEGDEVFHTSMVAAWERTGSSEGNRRLVHSPRSWLAGVVRNRAARGRREAARRTRRERRAARPEAQPSAADIVERREIQGRVAEAVLGLGEPYTSALLLRYWEDLKPRAIAAALSVPVETVRTRIKRGLGLLRSRLDDSFGERAAWLLPLADWSASDRQMTVPAVTGSTSAAGWAAGAAIAVALGLAGLVGMSGGPGPSNTPAAAIAVGGPQAIASERFVPVELQRVEWAAAQEPSPLGSAVAASATKAPPSAATIELAQLGPIAAASILQELATAQQNCRSAAQVDDDGDGNGEYAYFQDLAGVPRARDQQGKQRRRLRTFFRHGHGWMHEGVAPIGDYLFQMYLPGPAGVAVPEAGSGGVSIPAPEPDLAEKYWCCYAWPATAAAGVDHPVFFVDQEGTVLAAPNHGRRYVGLGSGPRPDAAFRAGTDGHLGDPKAADAAHPGHDGQVWIPPRLLESATRLRIVDAANRPVGRINVAIGSPSAWWLSPTALQALSLQRERLAQLGIRLAIGGGSTDAEGLATIEGPVAADATLLLRVQGMSLVPTRLALDGPILRAELPPPDPEELLRHYESAAIATLKNISSAQAQCQASAAIDGNGNGAGEYGYFSELAGSAILRGRERRLSPPVLSGGFAKYGTKEVPHARLIQRSGYLFQMFLPSAQGQALTDSAGSEAPDPVLSEVLWCCHAWPAVRGTSGLRAFFIDQSGDVLACDNDKQRYSGLGHPPRADFTHWVQARAAKVRAEPAVKVMNGQGGDGETWTVIN